MHCKLTTPLQAVCASPISNPPKIAELCKLVKQDDKLVDIPNVLKHRELACVHLLIIDHSSTRLDRIV